MIIAPLALEEHSQGYNRYAVVNFADVAGLGASATGTLTIAKPVPGVVAGPFAIACQTQFTSSDGGLISLTVSIGDAGSATRYIAASELLASFTQGFSSNTTFTNVTAPNTPILLTFTATATHNLSTITAGQFTIFWSVANLASLDLEVSTQNLVELTEPVS